MNNRKPLIAGNWKMNLDAPAAAALGRDVVQATGRFHNIEVVVIPPFPFLSLVAKTLEGSSIGLGAQDLSQQKAGAFTGDVAGEMLRDVGCDWVLVGHSERREIHAETDAMVAEKTNRALDVGLKPIVCVGERLAERDSGKTFDRIERQIMDGLGSLSRKQMEKIVIAYEPVWAIGTGRTATPAQAEEVHEFIRGLIARMFDDGLAAQIRILYGGSVKAENAATLMSEKDVDGALVGGASLSSDTFGKIASAGAGGK